VEYEVEMPAEEKSGSASAANRAKIVFFGIFGIENLGNECTLQSILQNARKRMPDAEIGAISYNPADTDERHHLAAIPVSNQNFAGVVRRGGLAGKLAKVTRMLRRIPGEFNAYVEPTWLS
jgi:polysaccharide pyruvyl transferase WcaK-like protein